MATVVPFSSHTDDDGILHVVDGDGAAWFAIDVVDGHAASFGVYAGAASRAMFDAAIPLSTNAIRRGPPAPGQARPPARPLTFFCDALYVRRYDSAFREQWVRWFLQHRAHVDRMHFAIPRQGLLRMGLQVVGLAVPNFVTAHDDDAGLDAVLGPHLPAFLRLRARRDAWLAR